MVKADSRFDSAIIDPWGRVVASTVDPEGETRATLVADVPLGSGRSPCVTFGDWFGWLTVAGTVAFSLLGVMLRLKARGLVNRG